MGTWGYKGFENDDALDFLGGLAERPSIGMLEEAFRAALKPEDGYLEAPFAQQAVAAAEMVAASLGKPCSDFPDEAKAIIEKRKLPIGNRQKANAIKAVKAVLKKSELQELWAESSECAKWQEAITELLARLSSTTSTSEDRSFFQRLFGK